MQIILTTKKDILEVSCNYYTSDEFTKSFKNISNNYGLKIIH